MKMLAGLMQWLRPRLQRRAQILRNWYWKNSCQWGHWGNEIRIGKGVIFSGDTRKIFLHDNCEISDQTRIIITGEGQIVLEPNSSIGPCNFINVQSPFCLGENSMTAPFVSINDSDHRVDSRKPVRFSGYITEPVAIGKDVWIATGARILKGVRIADGAIIGANCVVTKNVDSFDVAAGVPGKVIRTRVRRS